ncbi:MAG: RecX family transcriptional regulator [Flavobacteriia bacterium]|nr:RecX family transcriptional regulator [Flavobacteriia bacterium]
MNTLLNYEEVKLKMEKWCVYQERCIFDFNTKIKSFSLKENEIKNLLQHLLNHKFIDEIRYVEAIISGKKTQKKWGKNKIVYFLKSKNISIKQFEKLINNIVDENYHQNLHKLMIIKWNSFKDKYSVFERKSKLFNYLLSKGYTSDQIQEALSKYQKEIL